MRYGAFRSVMVCFGSRGKLLLVEVCRGELRFVNVSFGSRGELRYVTARCVAVDFGSRGLSGCVRVSWGTSG